MPSSIPEPSPTPQSPSPRSPSLNNIWPTKDVLAAVEQAVAHTFANADLLGAALVHRSAAAEAGAPQWAESQRLEFLGDAVLCLLTADWLMRHAGATTREGALTKMRSRLTNTEEFARLARTVGLDKAVVLGRGEDLEGGRERASLLADTFEAVFGAIWLDGGWAAAAKAFDHVFETERARVVMAGTEVNPKGQLQELALRLWGVSPCYALEKVSGPPHAPEFTVRVTIDASAANDFAADDKSTTPPPTMSPTEVREPTTCCATATGTSKQAAEVAAATALLARLASACAKKHPKRNCRLDPAAWLG